MSELLDRQKDRQLDRQRQKLKILRQLLVRIFRYRLFVGQIEADSWIDRDRQLDRQRQIVGQIEIDSWIDKDRKL